MTPNRKRVLRGLFLAAVLGLGAVLVYQDRAALTDSVSQLGDVEVSWVVAASAVELLAYVFSGLTLRVLLPRNQRPSVVSTTRISLAGQAAASALPGGPATAGVVMLRLLRRRGVPERASLGAILLLTLLQGLALPVLAIAGAQAPGAEEAVPGVQTLAIAFIAVVGALVLVGLLLHQRGALAKVLAWLRDHLPGFVTKPLEQYLPSPAQADREGNVPPSGPRDRRTLALAFGFAVLYWLLDALCLGLSFPAVGTGVPWAGLLLSYSAAQLATILPITPGGLGVVEGSLTVALVAFGAGGVKALAAVLLYRIISYFGVLVVGLLGGISRRRPTPRSHPSPQDDPTVAVVA